MERISIEEADGEETRTADERKPLTDALSLSDMAMNYYELDAGDSLSGGMHTHMEQEELFYVLEGTATFETPDGAVEVDEDEVIRFAPGEYQEGKNEHDERVRVLAMGAPQDDGEVRTRIPCRECGADYHVVEMGEDGPGLTCPDCGNQPDV